MKSQLRRAIRKARTEIGSRGATWSTEACARLVALPVFAAAKRVVLYVAVDGEVAAEVLQSAARAAGKRVFLPSVRDGGLVFLEDQSRGWGAGRWGIPEPVSDERLENGGPDVLFVVPGVAFDLRGHRLGRGQGAYDRALVRHPAAARIGVAYEFQIVPALANAPWDVPMDAVVTNARVIGARHVAG